MKRVLIKHIPVLLTMVVFTSISFANTSAKNSSSTYEMSNVDAFNEAEIYNAFVEINGLVALVAANDTVTSSDLKAQDNSLLSLLNEDQGNVSSDDNKFSFTPGMAYLTGCVFGTIGLVLVAIINNGDEKALKNAIWGCATSGCVSGATVAIIYFVYFYSVFTLSLY